MFFLDFLKDFLRIDPYNDYHNEYFAKSQLT